MKHFIGISRFLSKALILAVLWWVSFQPDLAIARIYKYKDDEGKTHFTDDASRIPLRYRKQGTVEKFKGVAEPTPAPGNSKGQNASAKKPGGEDEGLSSKEEALVRKTIQVFETGVALSKQYANVQPNFSNGIGAVNAIQSALPLKENLAGELEGTKVPELQSALGFLKQSIATDKETWSIGAGLTRRIAGILSRLQSEGEQQAGLIKQLEKALKDSKKKKAAAAEKKLEEAQKEFERKKAKAERRQKEAEQEKEE